MQLPRAAQTVVASWWPGRYYVVLTIGLDHTSSIYKLTQSLPGANPGKDFVTNIFRCDKDGLAKFFDRALYEQEYETLDEARAGHEMAVKMLVRGELRVIRAKGLQH